MNQAALTLRSDYIPVCDLSDLVPDSGVCALLPDGRQVALFLLPDEGGKVYALDNWDPAGRANVLSRGIVGDLEGVPVVASPLYKQHYRLDDGACLEDSVLRIRSYPVRLEGCRVLVQRLPAEPA